ncbi:hypothetical protein B296_00030647, partial [Ensete ventricosum]
MKVAKTLQRSLFVPWLSGHADDDRDVSVKSSAYPVDSACLRAFIVSVVGHSYLVTLLPLWLTISLYPSTTPVILA